MDIERINVQCERLVVPNIRVAVLGSPQIVANIIAADQNVTIALGSRKQEYEFLFEGTFGTLHHVILPDVARLKVHITHNKCMSGKGPPAPCRGSLTFTLGFGPSNPVAMEKGHGFPHSFGGGTQPSGAPKPITAVYVKSPLWSVPKTPSVRPIMVASVTGSRVAP